MADEIQQRLKAIHVAKEALTEKWAQAAEIRCVWDGLRGLPTDDSPRQTVPLGMARRTGGGVSVERLTTRSILGGWTLKVPRQEAVDRLSAYEDTGPKPVQTRNLAAVAHARSSNPIEERLELAAYRALGPVEKLSALVKAQDEGRVVPCKVGDTIFVITDTFNGKNIVQTIGSRKVDRIGGNKLNPIWVVSTEPYELH